MSQTRISGPFKVGPVGLEVEVVTADGELAVAGVAIKSSAAELDAAAKVSTRVVELVATAAVDAGVVQVELNHATVIIEASMVAPTNVLVMIKNTSASGTAAHTFTVSGGTLNGTNTIATLNAPKEALFVWFDSAGAGTVVENVGTIVLSGP